MIIETLGQLRELMSESFDRREVKTFCFDLRIEVEEISGENSFKSDMIRELIRFAHKEKRLLELIEVIKIFFGKENYQLAIDWDQTKLKMRDLQDAVINDKDFLLIPLPLPPKSKLPNYIETEELQSTSNFIKTNHSETAVLGLHGYVGVGKSALALHLAHQFREDFEDGVLWVDLNSLTLDADLVTMGMALGQGESVFKVADTSSKAQYIRQLLSDKHVLLVVNQADSDNQVLEWLLPQGKRNVVIVTTRDITQLQKIDALMVELSPFKIKETLGYLTLILEPQRVNAEKGAIQDLHNLVGGIPQALSIAAHQLRASPALKIAEYNSLLEDEQTRLEEIEMWTSSTMQITASIELSYVGLTNDVFRQVFAILGVFEGLTFDSWAVSSVADIKNIKAQLILGQLANHSLIAHIDADRYEINPLLKAFAISKLTNFKTYYERASKYFAEKARNSRLENGYSDLNSDWQNVVGLMHWASQNHSWHILVEGVLGLTQFSMGVMGFLDLRGFWSEARKLLLEALHGASQINNSVAELQIRLNLAGFAHKQNDQESRDEQIDIVETQFEEILSNEQNMILRIQYFDLKSNVMLQKDRAKASSFLEEGIKLLSSVKTDNTNHQLGYLKSELSGTLGRSGEFEQAMEVAKESLDLLPSWPSSAKLVSMINMGVILRETGRVKESNSWLEQATVIAKAVGDTNRLGSSWVNLGLNCKHLGQLHKAIEYYENGLSIYRQSGNLHYQIGVLMNMGQINYILGDYDEAQNLYDQALKIALENNVKDIEAMVYSNIAELLLEMKEFKKANVILNKAWNICQELELAHLRPTVMRQQMQVLQAYGSHKKVLIGINQVIQEAEKTSDKLEQGIAYRVKGISFFALTNWNEGLFAIKQSERMLVDQEIFELGRTLATMAQYFDTLMAIKNAKEAKSIFEQLSARKELNQIESWLESL